MGLARPDSAAGLAWEALEKGQHAGIEFGPRRMFVSDALRTCVLEKYPLLSGQAANHSTTAVWLDALCLIAITFASAAAYLGNIGFYSDDWTLIGGFHFAAQEGRLALAELARSYGPRPLHGLYTLLLYQLFGLHPLGYHLVNTAVIAACIALAYLLLVRLKVARADAFAAAIILAILPQLSTVRVWIATANIPLSMLFMLLSLHSQLSFARAHRVRWVVLAIVAAALSLAAYETFAPLIIGFAVGLALAGRGALDAVRSAGRWRTAAPLLLVVAVVAFAVVAKLLTSDRAGPIGDPQRYVDGLRQLVRWDYDWRIHSSLNVYAAVLVHLWMTVTGWAAAAADLATGRSGATVSAWALAVAALAAWRIGTANGVRGEGLRPVPLLLLGAAAFILGHATYLVVPSILFAPTGVANRSLVAAAIGVAIVLAALSALAARTVPVRLRTAALAAIVSLIALFGVVRINAIARYWAEAPALQRQVLEPARRDLRALPANSTVILDGVCPYHGPAVVFETWWDVGGALSIALGRPVKGDIVTPRMSRTAAGLETSIYQEPAIYPYGRGLYVYNPVRRSLVALDNAASAERYFRGTDRAECPVSFPGHGVLI